MSFCCGDTSKIEMTAGCTGFAAENLKSANRGGCNLTTGLIGKASYSQVSLIGFCVIRFHLSRVKKGDVLGNY